MNIYIKKALRGLFLISVLLVSLALCGCTAQEQTPAAEPEQEGAVQEEIAGESETLPLEDYPPQTVETYPFMEGTVEENTVTVITSEVEGPCIYVVGGIHGDEIAGWMAGERLRDEVRIKCGTLYILSPVNRSGAEAETRYVGNSGDMNRAFPGNVDSEDMAEKIAGHLFAEIERVQPDFVLDLHEARFELGTGSTYAGLANTLIYTDDSQISDLLFDFLLENESGALLDRKFGLTTPGVAGSFNRTVSEQLGIPVITTETWRQLEVEHRIGQQLEIINFCLSHYAMADRLA